MIKLVESNYSSESPKKNNKKNKQIYYEFQDEEDPVKQDNQKIQQQQQSMNQLQRRKSKKKSKKFRSRVMGQAKRIVIEPIEKSQLYQFTKIEFQNQNQRQRIQTYMASGCCIYWILNSIIGIYILSTDPLLRDQHPLIFEYLLIFSSKWILSCFVSGFLMLISCFILKLCCRTELVCQNTIGAFPLIYLFVIFMSYMYSLYYGVLILREVYDPQNKEEEMSYIFQDEQELMLLKVFVFNEIIVGAIIILQIFVVLFCGKISKSEHLVEIEGADFGVDEDEVQRIKRELMESRKRTESMLKENKSSMAININDIKEELKKNKDETQEQRGRSASHNLSYRQAFSLRKEDKESPMYQNYKRTMTLNSSAQDYNKVNEQYKHVHPQNLQIHLQKLQQEDDSTNQNNLQTYNNYKLNEEKNNEYDQNVPSTQINQSSLIMNKGEYNSAQNLIQNQSLHISKDNSSGKKQRGAKLVLDDIIKEDNQENIASHGSAKNEKEL